MAAQRSWRWRFCENTNAGTGRGVGRGLGSAGTPVAISAAGGRAWSSPSGHAGGVERGAVDSAHRGAVAGAAHKVSSVPDRAWALPAMGALRPVAEGAAHTGREVARARITRPARGHHRRQFREREKGGLAVGKTKRGKGTKVMAVATATSVPLAVTVDSASPHESKLVDETLAGSFLDELPERLIGDKAYDSDPLDRHLAEDYGIEMIAPNRENRSPTQDGRALRRYRRRWAVERLFAWLQWVPETGDALRISCRQLPRHAPAWLHENHAEILMKTIYQTGSSVMIASVRQRLLWHSCCPMGHSHLV